MYWIYKKKLKKNITTLKHSKRDEQIKSLKLDFQVTLGLVINHGVFLCLHKRFEEMALQLAYKATTCGLLFPLLVQYIL